MASEKAKVVSLDNRKLVEETVSSINVFVPRRLVNGRSLLIV